MSQAARPPAKPGRDYRAPSRHTNEVNSVTPPEEGNAADSRAPELPNPVDRAAEFLEKYPNRARLPLTRQNGRSLRSELLKRPTETAHVNPPEEWLISIEVTEEIAANPVTWGEAVYRLLDAHADTLSTTIHLERAEPGHPEHATHDVNATDRWMTQYQKKYFAQLKGWLRELCGGERPSGGETQPSFDNPYIALITRSASAVPDGEHVPPVDHADAIRESWQDVYHTLRNHMRAMGYELGEDWQYERRLEPHKSERGGGLNRCYPHEHIVLVVDGKITTDDLAPLLDKHVDACEWAGEKAHHPSKAIEIKPANEVEDLAAYVGSYAGIKPVDLLERSPEYIAFAAAYWSSFSKTKSRSDAAKHASTADRCKQRYESPHSDQAQDHGESVIRREIRGNRVLVCEECGSPHDIDQSQTLSAARLDNSSPTVVADGGFDPEGELRDRWPSARSAASVGELPSRAHDRKRIERALLEDPHVSTPALLGRLGLRPDRADLVEEVRNDLGRDEVVGFERPPEWRVDAITVDGERHDVGESSGISLDDTCLGGELLAEYLLEKTILGETGADRTLWRVFDEFNTWNPKTVARAMSDHQIRDPEIAEACIEPIRGALC